MVQTAGAAAQAVPSAPYPSETVVGAFFEGCAELTDFDRARSAATAAGWQPFELGPGDPWYGIRQRNPSAVRSADFRRQVAGRNLTLSISIGSSRDGRLHELHCRLYDFEAEQPIDVNVIERRIGQAAQRSQINARGEHQAVFSPLFQGHRNGSAGFMPAALAAQYGVPDLRGLNIHTWWTNVTDMGPHLTPLYTGPLSGREEGNK